MEGPSRRHNAPCHVRGIIGVGLARARESGLITVGAEGGAVALLVALDVDDLSKGVVDADEVGSVLHHDADVLVGVGMLIE